MIIVDPFQLRLFYGSTKNFTFYSFSFTFLGFNIHTLVVDWSQV